MKKIKSKILSLLLACLLIVTAGCSSAEDGRIPELRTEKDRVEDPRPISCSDELDGEAITILTEDNFREGMKELLRCYHYLAAGETPAVRVQYLSPDRERRRVQIENLRLEMMAGNGPDAFILSSTHPEADSLFRVPEGAMRSNFFLPLNGLINESEILQVSEMNPVVFDAGKVGKTQYLLPLLYTFGISAVRAPQSGIAPDSCDSQEKLSASGDEKLQVSARKPAQELPGNAFPQLVDYEEERLCITREELAEQYRIAAADRDREGYEPLSEICTVSRWLFGEISKYGSEEKVLIPFYNTDGGITAAVTAYAGINRNSKHPRAAFSVLEVLFREELVTGEGLVRKGSPYDTYYGQLFDDYVFCLGSGVSVLDSLWIQGNDYFRLSPDDQQFFNACFQKIDHARIRSDLDVEMEKGMSELKADPGGKDPETIADEVYQRMQMILAEA